MNITGRQLTVMVVAVSIAAVLTPAAVNAATGSSVNITDPFSSTAKARVVSGRLAIGDGSGAVTVDGSTVALEPPTAWSAYDRITNDGSDQLSAKIVAANVGISLGSLTMSRVTGTAPIIVQVRTIIPTTAGNCSSGTVAEEVGQFTLPADETRTITWAPRLRVKKTASQTCLIVHTSGGTNGDLTTVHVTGATW